MKLTWARDASILQYGDKSIRVVCDVRNELNGERLPSEHPVYSEKADGSQGLPFMPRPFPLGEWKVLAVLPKTSPYEAPEFISTDAHQPVPVYDIVEDQTDSHGVHYGNPTGEYIEDFGYGLHNSTSSTTLGCGRIVENQDRADLTAAIRAAMDAGEAVILEVV
jgi:hypothetical protein